MKRRSIAFTALAAAAATLFLSACGGKDINNKDQVRQAVVEHLSKRGDLNMDAMDVQVASVSFEKDQAKATVSVTPKGMKDGMQMSYALVRKGDKWEVKGKQDSGMSNHGGALPAPPPGAPGGGDPHGGAGK
ncbi:MAG: hypothetical protein JST65_03105 [Acidobacteria bacterium]|nr:hypothetical protein [Acidobacteriota bacterium]